MNLRNNAWICRSALLFSFLLLIGPGCPVAWAQGVLPPSDQEEVKNPVAEGVKVASPGQPLSGGEVESSGSGASPDPTLAIRERGGFKSFWKQVFPPRRGVKGFLRKIFAWVIGFFFGGVFGNPGNPGLGTDPGTIAAPPVTTGTGADNGSGTGAGSVPGTGSGAGTGLGTGSGSGSGTATGNSSLYEVNPDYLSYPLPPAGSQNQTPASLGIQNKHGISMTDSSPHTVGPNRMTAGTWTNPEMTIVDEVLGKLPPLMRGSVKEIVKTGGFLDAATGAESAVWGLCSGPRIYLTQYPDDTDGNLLRYTLIHEMGHSFALKYPAVFNEYKRLFWNGNIPTAGHKDEYGIGNPEEDFVDCISRFYLGDARPPSIKESDLAKYEFVKTFVMEGKEY